MTLQGDNMKLCLTLICTCMSTCVLGEHRAQGLRMSNTELLTKDFKETQTPAFEKHRAQSPRRSNSEVLNKDFKGTETAELVKSRDPRLSNNEMLMQHFRESQTPNKTVIFSSLEDYPKLTKDLQKAHSNNSDPLKPHLWRFQSDSKTEKSSSRQILMALVMVTLVLVTLVLLVLILVVLVANTYVFDPKMSCPGKSHHGMLVASTSVFDSQMTCPEKSHHGDMMVTYTKTRNHPAESSHQLMPLTHARV